LVRGANIESFLIIAKNLCNYLMRGPVFLSS
jgi:hypothetical protein